MQPRTTTRAPDVPTRPEIARGRRARDLVLGPALLGERHEERTRGVQDLASRVERADRAAVRVGERRSLPSRERRSDRASRPRRPRARAAATAASAPGATTPTTGTGDISLDRVERERRGRVACDDDGLDAVVQEEADGAARVASHGLGRTSCRRAAAPCRRGRGAARAGAVARLRRARSGRPRRSRRGRSAGRRSRRLPLRPRWAPSPASPAGRETARASRSPSAPGSVSAAAARAAAPRRPRA